MRKTLRKARRLSVPIVLVGLTTTTDHEGVAQSVQTRRTVLSDRESVRQSEFYKAAAAGFRPEATFVIWAGEYQGEARVESDGREYDVIRTYSADEKFMELVCTGKVSTSG